MKDFTEDENGLLVQSVSYLRSGFDGGDSLNWEAHRTFLDRSQYNWFNTYFGSHKYPGLYVRHPNPEHSMHGFASYCGGNWDGVESRDQMTGKLCLLAKDESSYLKGCLIQHLKRGMIFANNTVTNGENPNDSKRKLPDLTLFDIWALYIRGFRSWYLYPLLCVFDLHLFSSAIINRFSSNSDPISFAIKAILANEVMPTPVIWLMNRVISADKLMGELKDYWSGWRGQPGMVPLYRPYVYKYFGGE